MSDDFREKAEKPGNIPNVLSRKAPEAAEICAACGFSNDSFPDDS